MSETKISGEGEVSQRSPSRWTEVIENYSTQLQLDRDGEGEGHLSVLENLFFGRIFDDYPEEAAHLYAALLRSADPQIRIASLRGLEKLAEVDLPAASEHIYKLLRDDELEVRAAAFRFED